MYIWKHLFDYTRDQRASTFPVDLFLDPKDIFCIIHTTEKSVFNRLNSKYICTSFFRQNTLTVFESQEKLLQSFHFLTTLGFFLVSLMHDGLLSIDRLCSEDFILILLTLQT